MVGHGGSSAGSYLADPTSPIPSHCASIVATSTVRVNIEIQPEFMGAFQFRVYIWSHSLFFYSCGYGEVQPITVVNLSQTLHCVTSHLHNHHGSQDSWQRNSATWKTQSKCDVHFCGFVLLLVSEETNILQDIISPLIHHSTRHTLFWLINYM